MLLQVLLVRDARGPPLRARGGSRDPRRGRAPAGQGAARADGRAPGGQPRRARATTPIWTRGLHRICRVGVRAGTRARPAPAHQSRRAVERGSGATARCDRVAGSDARVDLRAAYADRSRGIADQASCAPPGDDPGGRPAEDPVHERDSRGDRRDRAGAAGIAGGARRGAHRVRAYPGGDPAELRSPPALLRAGARADRRRGRAGVLAHRRVGRPPAAAAAGVGVSGEHRGHEDPDLRNAPADAGCGHSDPAEPRRLVGGAGRGGRQRPRRAERQWRPHLARASVPVAASRAQGAAG